MNYEKITAFGDGGHSWARVPRSEIELAALQGLEISRYSFMTDKYVYLEEDCDLSAWIEFRKIPRETVQKWKIKHTDRLSHIRNYPRVNMLTLKGIQS